MDASLELVDAEIRTAEESEVHTRLLRLALGIEESRAYWRHVDPAVPPGRRAVQAFEERWFGGKSIERVRTLLTYFGARYDAFPAALDLLKRWSSMDPTERQVVCHWHLQLTDPIYRRFTGGFLVERRPAAAPATLDRNVVARWMTATHPERWGAATIVQFASKLLSAASEAGLITPRRDPRRPLVPKVSDVALEYLLYLLRLVSFEGTMLENPYLASVGLDGPFLEHRLRTLPALAYRRMEDLVEFGWRYPDLAAWGEATL
jgi:hypothetical protein